MANRLVLQELLESLLSSKEVYFQPPESVKMKYPCFVYSLENLPVQRADDSNYKVNERYLVRYITRNPDDSVIDDIIRVRGFAFERRYVADNLHHYVYTYTFY